MSLFKSVSTVSLLTLASRITGLVRELLVAATFGASALTDAFNVAFRIPNLFRRLFAEGAFSQAFVPVLAANKAQHGDASTKLLIDRVATLLFWVLLLTCVIGVVCAPVLVWLMASGLQHGGRFDVAVVMTRWMFPYIGFMSLVALSAGVLNTYHRFAVPAVTPVLLNIAMVAAAWLGAPWFERLGYEPIYAMSAGVMVGGALQLGVQIPALMRLGLLPNIAWKWSAICAAVGDATTQNILRLMLPALLGVSVAQISLLINTQIASHLASGSVSWLSYADRLMEFPTALLGVALGVVLMPQLAAAKAAGDQRAYSDMLDWGLRVVLVLALPCAVALLTFSQPLVAVLFHYGAFTAYDVRQTSLALTGYGVGLLGLVAVKILASGFYANQNTKTPVAVALLVLCMTQLFNVVLVPQLQHAGLALSIGMGALLNALLLLVTLVRRGHYQPAAGWRVLGLQVLLANGLLTGCLLVAAQWIDWPALRAVPGQRIWLVFLVLSGSSAIYLGALRLAGLRLVQLIRR